MSFVADLHIHSHFSRATSKELNLEYLSKWAQLKGVQVVGTGDIAHPGWLDEMKKKLEPAEEGLFRLKEDYVKSIQREMFKACQGTVRFMLAGEISNIYKKNDKVRKIHNVVFLPSFDAVEKLQASLEKIGNIRSDGRPILGLDSHDLLEIVLETDPQAYLIPAHIWTPWFSLLGSMSGFDSVEECFEELTPQIFALETGLSSDPPMNWRLSALDRYTLVSNSDAHSPQKLAREANIFNTELSYPAIFRALKSKDSEAFLGTIEFFPEEGKYHYDGHRKCGIQWDPKTTIKHNGICPECGKKVTVGVMHRVETLADREKGAKPKRSHPFKSLIPLSEILAEIYRVGVNSKRIQESFEKLLTKLGPELNILKDIPLEDIANIGDALLAEAIRRMRLAEIKTIAGYDGEYGIIRVFEDEEREAFSTQLGFFSSEGKKEEQIISPTQQLILKDKNLAEKLGTVQTPTKLRQKRSANQAYIELSGVDSHPKKKIEINQEEHPILFGLNIEQKEAVQCTNIPLIIVAGPGTGKTRTLTHRMAYLVHEKGVSPENLLAVAFTNKAAEEMADRLKNLLDPKVANQITIKTFHAFGSLILRSEGERIGLEPKYTIYSETDRRTLLKNINLSLKDKEIHLYLDKISSAKNQLLSPEACSIKDEFKDAPEFIDIYQKYELSLLKNHVLDFDDLISLSVKLFEENPDVLQKYQNRFRWISVDEYQDINLAQYRLLRLLTAPEVNICVIGDPNQAIYGFRGANREFFLKFQTDFPNTKIVHLSQNYRSTQLILDASEQVMAKSTKGQNLEIWSDLVSKTKLEIYQTPTHKAEAEYVVHKIEKMMGGTSYFSIDSGRIGAEDETTSMSFSDFAVLYRLNAQSKSLEEALLRSGIPYQTVGEIHFFERKEITAILSFLWFLYNSNSISHLHKIFNHFKPGTRIENLKNIFELANEKKASFWQVLQNFKEYNFWDTSQKKIFYNIVPILKALKKAAESQTVSQLIDLVGKYTNIKKSFQLDEKYSELFNKLISKALPFENRLGDFLESTVLQKETDDYDPRADRVTLMTLHASKGLEFPVVFIVGCEENLIPYQREGHTFDLEEERRLFYVGMTRAQQKLILTHANNRFLFGQKRQNPPSRFLSDIEDTLIELKRMESQKPKKEDKSKTQMSLF
ncbi:MAG: UvrD-helicase domain-containing protein [bacterium]